MPEDITLGDAVEEDVGGIVALLRANRDELFLRSQRDVQRRCADFIVARDARGVVLGCAALHRYSAGLAEVLSVAVQPERQGHGIGSRLLAECTRRAQQRGGERLFLATLKPAYFARFGYTVISQWRLPASVLLAKLGQVFRQPVATWLPTLFGHFTFMERELGHE